MPKAPLLPAATFPPLTWFHLAQREGAHVCRHENYVKQSLRNRVSLVNPQGPTTVTLPVHRRGASTRSVQDIVFTDAVHPELLLKVLRTNCGRAPFFEHYFPEIEDWAHRQLKAGQSWLDAAEASVQWACDTLGTPLPAPTSTYESGDGWDDWRPKARWNDVDTPRYPQVFEDRLGFVSGRSILDVIFHLGPEASSLPSRHGNHDVA